MRERAAEVLGDEVAVGQRHEAVVGTVPRERAAGRRPAGRRRAGGRGCRTRRAPRRPAATPSPPGHIGPPARSGRAVEHGEGRGSSRSTKHGEPGPGSWRRSEEVVGAGDRHRGHRSGPDVDLERGARPGRRAARRDLAAAGTTVLVGPGHGVSSSATIAVVRPPPCGGPTCAGRAGAARRSRTSRARRARGTGRRATPPSSGVEGPAQLGAEEGTALADLASADLVAVGGHPGGAGRRRDGLEEPQPGGHDEVDLLVGGRVGSDVDVEQGTGRAEVLVDGGPHEVVLVVEVAEQRAGGDAGPLGDLGRARLVAVLAEQLDQRVEDGLAVSRRCGAGRRPPPRRQPNLVTGRLPLPGSLTCRHRG